MFNDYIAQMCNKRMKTMYCASGIEARFRDGGTSEAHGAAAPAVFKRLTIGCPTCFQEFSLNRILNR